jgi:glycosyltransferase involved in cell wall biosynthesis
MRIGLNPMRGSTTLKLPENVTVATVTYIPFLAGYWEQSLDVLKLCIGSLRANTGIPFDLMVYDNGSCREVIDYLLELRAAGTVQQLILNSDNIGKLGALEFVLAATRSKYIAYTDSDVYFYSGWLEQEMRVMEVFPDVGMVSGVPTVQNFGVCTTSTIKFAEADPETNLERGRMIPDDWIHDYAASIGFTPEDFLKYHEGLEEVRLTRHGVRAYATATHFQFLARADILKSILPLAPAADKRDAVLDEALDAKGYLRLSVDGVFVHHIGNALTNEWLAEGNKLGVLTKSRFSYPTRKVPFETLPGLVARISFVRRLIRRPLLFTYKQSFRLLSKLRPDLWT